VAQVVSDDPEHLIARGQRTPQRVLVLLPRDATGVGQIQGDKIVMDSGRRLGAKFPPNFLPADAVGVPWGTLTFTFTDCDHGHVEWTTTDAAFTPSGGMDIERLTQVAGTTCP
jgi:hypothetical protein